MIFSVRKQSESSHQNLTDEVEVLQSKYALSEQTVKRILKLRTFIFNERKALLNYDNLILFLNQAMSFGDIQVWLLEKEINGESVSFNDSLTKLFELNDNQSILKLYDIGQRFNKNNIGCVEKNVIKEKKIKTTKCLIKK